MPVLHVPGAFKVVGASPDGDSVRFYPDDPLVFERAGLPVRLNAHGGAQLRLDAIDALETHYTPPRGRHTWHQPRELAGAAAEALLDHLGFTDVVRSESGTVRSAAPDSTRGYILTRFADAYGRAVAFAFAGDRPGPPGSARDADGPGPDADTTGDDTTDDDGPDDGPGDDGSEDDGSGDDGSGDDGPDDDGPTGRRVTAGGQPTVHLGVRELRRSANHALLAAGLVYPTFYSRLYVDLRTALARIADTARHERRGVWARDVTLSGAELTSREQLEDELVLLPKLFRRLAEFLSLDESGSTSLRGFRAFLAQHDDRLFTVPEGQATGLDTLVRVRGRRVRMTLPPQQVVFVEK